MQWIPLDPSAVVDLITWRLSKYRDETEDLLWHIRSEIRQLTASAMVKTQLCSDGRYPILELEDQEPNKRVIENENLNSHFI